nr:DUF262 domain-containing protein [Ferrimicrobium acidiphilum]
MPIQRAGETPPFVELPLRYVIIDSNLPRPSPVVNSLGPTPIQIPTFQRGIEWGREEVSKLLNSTSCLYGTVILGSFPGQPQVLIDGLQRFAVATALLECLYEPVLQPNPTNQAAVPFFTRLRARTAFFHPLVSFNTEALAQHKRLVIKNSFLRLLQEIDEYVRDELNAANVQHFGTVVERMFLDRQVAIDPYFNFQSPSQMAATFVNLNTTGIELSATDLLRSRIVDQATTVGWSDKDISDMENRFSEVFDAPNAQPQLRALGKAADEIVQDLSTVGFLFTNWASLAPREVETFLNFVELASTIGPTTDSSGYYKELFQSSPAVFALTVLYYYRDSMSAGSIPSFMGGTRNVDDGLHLILRAVYRRILDGTVFRIGDMTRSILISNPLYTPQDVADLLNPESVCGALSTNPNPQWLSQRLREVGVSSAKRIFNACLLPPRTMIGGEFRVLDFGRRTVQWSIDHLIPKAQVSANTQGESATETIVNLAPLPTQHNRAARDTPCSKKLGNDGIYQRPDLVASHPYIAWLVQSHYPAHSISPEVLDDPSGLLSEVPGSVGEERVAALSKILQARL